MIGLKHKNNLNNKMRANFDQRCSNPGGDKSLVTLVTIQEITFPDYNLKSWVELTQMQTKCV